MAGRKSGAALVRLHEMEGQGRECRVLQVRLVPFWVALVPESLCGVKMPRDFLLSVSLDQRGICFMGSTCYYWCVIFVAKLK
jgi:hypothetical protein